MGDVIGLELSDVEVLARWVGFDIGLEEALYLERLESEWLRARRIARERRQAAKDLGTPYEEDEPDDE